MPVPYATYAPRFRLPEIIERSQAETLTCPVYRDGALAAPTSGTFTLLRPSGETYVTGSVTVTGSTATYALAAVPTTESCGEGWRVEWTLAMPDGISHTFRNTACLVLRRLYPVITDLDLTALHPDLETLYSDGQASWQGVIEETWYQIQRRLLADARRPWLIVEPSALRDHHVQKCLETIFRSAATSADPTGRWQSLADHYAQVGRSAWEGIRFVYDDSEQSTSTSRQAAKPVMWLCPLDRPTFI